MRVLVVMAMLVGCKSEPNWWCVDGDGACFRSLTRCDAVLKASERCVRRDEAWCDEVQCFGSLSNKGCMPEKGCDPSK